MKKIKLNRGYFALVDDGDYDSLSCYSWSVQVTKYFVSEIDAAKKYDEAAKEYHGEFANLNFK